MSHIRKTEDNRRMKKLWNETKTWYACGCWKGDDGRYRKYWPHKSRKKPLRIISNRKFRRRKEEIFFGKGTYRRVYDLWWQLY